MSPCHLLTLLIPFGGADDVCRRPGGAQKRDKGHVPLPPCDAAEPGLKSEVFAPENRPTGWPQKAAWVQLWEWNV